MLPATRRPAAGALFYLEGGPGGAATASAIRVNALFARVGRNRDLVMVDQRGTGGSSRLACPHPYVRGADAKAVTDYLRRCLARLDADPRLYTTSVAADDLETVRRTLGYGKIDLYGGSYGATLAQAYVRRYPESVRSVVLDSGSLPDVRIYDVSARNAERALEAHARPLRGRARLQARLPPLEAATRRAARTPTAPRQRRHRAGCCFGPTTSPGRWTGSPRRPTNAAIIPFAVNAAAHGDYTTLATTYAAQLGGSNLDPLARLVPFWVILCSEPWAAFDPAATARAGKGSYLARAALARARLFRRACRVVPKGRVPRRRRPPPSRARADCCCWPAAPTRSTRPRTSAAGAGSSRTDV